jgi:hypothetical protein
LAKAEGSARRLRPCTIDALLKVSALGIFVVSACQIRGGDGEQAKELKPITLPFLISQEPQPARAFATIPSAEAPFTVLIAFSYTDCYSGLADVPFWSSLQRELGSDVRVVGATTGSGENVLRYVLERQGVGFPVLYDPTGTIFAVLHRWGHLTPAVVLSNRAGNVLLVAGSQYGRLDDQRRLTRRLQMATSRERPGLQAAQATRF